jgi:hypothetical protein
MSTFIIDAENSITALTTEEAAAGIPSGATPFTSDRELARLAADWPAERLLEIWNGIPGVKPVTRFTSRKAAVTRIWKAIQGLTKSVEPESTPKPRARGAKTARKPKAKSARKQPGRSGSKQAQVLDMLRRKGGCTLDEIMKATGWQAHTVRGFISGTVGKKLGLEVSSAKTESGGRTYRVPR